MAPVSMLPAQPPLPTARNFPFQFSPGIHNSISMRESGDGASTAATRQYAGRGAPCAPRPPRPGCCAPAGTDSTALIVVFGNESDFKPSHAVCGDAAANSTTARVVIMGEPPKMMMSHGQYIISFNDDIW